MNEKKLDIRRIWAVLVLLDGSKKKQKEIEDEINGIDYRISSINKKLNGEFSKGIKRELKNKVHSKEEKRLALKGLKLFKNFERISFKSSSKTEIFGYLEQKGIIKRKDIPIENSNLTEKLCWIPVEFENLYNISNLISKSRIEINRRSFFSYIFVTSKIGKKLLNDFISSIPEELTYLKPPLNEKEMEIVKTLVTVSLNCLNYVIEDINFRTIDIYHKKSIFLLQLQSFFLSDIAQSRYFSSLIVDEIEFKTSISLKKKVNNDTDCRILNISTNLENDEFKTKIEFIPPTKNLSFDTLTYRYLRDTKLRAFSDLEKEMTK